MTPKFKKSKDPYKGPLSAIILIEVTPHEHHDILKSVKMDLENLTGVEEVWGIIGTWDLSLIVEAPSFEELTTKIIEEIRSIPGVGKTKTLPRFPL